MRLPAVQPICSSPLPRKGSGIAAIFSSTAANPALGHTGFGRLVLKEESDGMSIDSYFHYLHHRYFECNYGTVTVPFDRLFGSLHDGSPESYERMRRKQRTPAKTDPEAGSA